MTVGLFFSNFNLIDLEGASEKEPQAPCFYSERWNAKVAIAHPAIHASQRDHVAIKNGERRDPRLKHGRRVPIDNAQQGSIARRKIMCVPPVALTTLDSVKAHFWNLFVVATWHAWSQRARRTPHQPDIIPGCTESHPPFDLAACRRRSRTARQGDLYDRFHAMTPRLRTLVPASSDSGGSLTAGLPRKGRVVTEPVLCRAPDVSPFSRLSPHSAPGQRLSRASKVTFANWCWRSCPSATAWSWMTYRRADARRARPTPCT